MTAPLAERKAARPLRIAVRDGSVLWHIQLTPETSLGALLTGAWNIEDPTPLLGDAILLPVSEDDAVDGVPTTSLEEIVEVMTQEVRCLRAAVKEAVSKNSSLTALRIPDVVTPHPEELAKSFTGEPEARRAWSYAMAVAQLVQQWTAIESQRRSRKYLQEQFGSEPRPLPLQGDPSK